MKIAVTSSGGSLDSAVSEKFGRAPYFVIVDSETMAFEPVLNAAEAVNSGAGPEAVRQIAARGAQLLLTGHVGGNAQQALDAAGIKAVTGITPPDTVRQAVGKYLKK